MANVYSKDLLDRYDVQELSWRDDKEPDAKRLRDAKARQLRKDGWTVKTETYDFTDLGRFRGYGLTANRERKEVD